MIGKVLTTLGSTPDEDRKLFSDLGLNVARQTDNGANPRPDNRSGWLEGATPEPAAGAEAEEAPAAPDPLVVRLWDPSKQLRFAAKQNRGTAAAER